MNRKIRWRRFAAWLIATLLIWTTLSGCAADVTAGSQGSHGTEAVTVADRAGGNTAETVTDVGSTEGGATEAVTDAGARENAADVGSTDAGAADRDTVEDELEETTPETVAAPDEDGTYTTRDEVALYLHTYGRLPDNYITKKEAQELGWNSKKGNLEAVAPGKSIGGSHFGNYEGQLPEAKGRKYYECDLDYEGGYRGAERLIYSNDGLIFYTGDHYKTFEQLY